MVKGTTAGRPLLALALAAAPGCFYKDNPLFAEDEHAGSGSSASSPVTGGASPPGSEGTAGPAGTGSTDEPSTGAPQTSDESSTGLGPAGPPPGDATSIGDCPAPIGEQSVLAGAAGGLPPGSWCTLSMGGLDQPLIDTDSGPAIAWGGQAVYDASRRKIRFMGGGTNGDPRCLEYDEDADLWSQCALPDPFGGGSSFDHTALDRATGRHFTREYGGNGPYRVWTAGDPDPTWTYLPGVTSCPLDGESTAALTWDESRGGLVLLGVQGVCFYDAQREAWHVEAELGVLDGSSQAEYDIRNRAVWLQDGGDSHRHWIADSDGVTELADPGFSLGCCNDTGVLTNYDIVSGHFIVALPHANTWRSYDLARDAWHTFTNDLPIHHGQGGLAQISATLIELEAILYIRVESANDPSAYLYRPA